MLLQAYDFWHLFKTHNCRLQMGGNDQWGNILAGADLTRRMEGEIIHGLTFPLLTASSGIKMGKTHKGAVWLDPELTSPYDYYQYWINQDDLDVGRFLSLFTLLPMDQIRGLQRLEGSDIRKAKEVLAYEATRLCHGKGAADQAQQASRQLFGPDTSASSESVPVYRLSQARLESGIPSYVLFEDAGLCKTKSEARRLIAQGGGYLNGRKIKTFDQVVTAKDLEDHSLLLRAGKKRYMKVILD
jgi:tyrosyl-tRNA synthetase